MADEKKSEGEYQSALDAYNESDAGKLYQKQLADYNQAVADFQKSAIQVVPIQPADQPVFRLSRLESRTIQCP